MLRKCRKTVAAHELRALIDEADHETFCDRQARSALTDSVYISCVNDGCSNVMERLPAADGEARAAKDAKELCRLEFRMRCREVRSFVGFFFQKTSLKLFLKFESFMNDWSFSILLKKKSF